MAVLKQKEYDLYIEVTQLKSGKSFGELALINNKPRAATIRAKKDCHFAVMQKADYQKVLQKIEQKKLNQIIEFLQGLPFLQKWSKTALAKLQFSFELKTYNRMQVVFREKEKADFAFIIKEGEFEVSKQVIVGAK